MRIILWPIRWLLITPFNRKLIITHAPLHGCDAAARQGPNYWTFVGFAIKKKKKSHAGRKVRKCGFSRSRYSSEYVNKNGQLLTFGLYLSVFVSENGIEYETAFLPFINSLKRRIWDRSLVCLLFILIDFESRHNMLWCWKIIYMF